MFGRPLPICPLHHAFQGAPPSSEISQLCSQSGTKCTVSRRWFAVEVCDSFTRSNSTQRFFLRNRLRFLCGNDTVAVAMHFAMKNGQICFSLRKFLAISPAIQKIASDCGCDVVVHLGQARKRSTKTTFGVQISSGEVFLCLTCSWRFFCLQSSFFAYGPFRFLLEALSNCK